MEINRIQIEVAVDSRPVGWTWNAKFNSITVVNDLKFQKRNGEAELCSESKSKFPTEFKYRTKTFVDGEEGTPIAIDLNDDGGFWTKISSMVACAEAAVQKFIEDNFEEFKL